MPVSSATCSIVQYRFSMAQVSAGRLQILLMVIDGRQVSPARGGIARLAASGTVFRDPWTSTVPCISVQGCRAEAEAARSRGWLSHQHQRLPRHRDGRGEQARARSDQPHRHRHGRHLTLPASCWRQGDCGHRWGLGSTNGPIPSLSAAMACSQGKSGAGTTRPSGKWVGVIVVLPKRRWICWWRARIRIV